MGQSASSLHLEIAESIRRLIAAGELKPGDRLPAVRELTRRWGCAPGTVSRAYARLAQEGLVTAHRGGGTRVARGAIPPALSAQGWAALVNRAEAFLLEALSGGHTPAQAEAALAVAVARWRELQEKGAPRPPAVVPANRLRFVGSHDLVMESLVRLLAEHPSAGGSRAGAPVVALTTEYVGSLGGLMALARGEAEVAGIHLWDAATDTYNAPFVQRVLPGRRVVLLTLAHRSLGLILPPGNPQGLHTLADLTRPGVRLANRQPGSGTRVWLDAQLKAVGVASESVPGYEQIERTHLAVARAVAQGKATVGLGLQAAAVSYGLDFAPLIQERYDLVLPAEVWETPTAQALVVVIRSPRFQEAVLALAGYDPTAAGQETWMG